MANFSTLDKLDRKIIYGLDLNSRIAASKLARNLKVSREEVVRNADRIRDLIKQFLDAYQKENKKTKYGLTFYIL